MGDNNTNNNTKKYYSLITSCAVIISIVSFILDVWGIILYDTLNKNGDTSKMKDLLLAYFILQAITCVATFAFASSGGFWLAIGSMCNLSKLGVWLAFLSIPISAIVSLVCMISTIVLAVWISSEFFTYPWVNAFVSYSTMLGFVITLLIVHIIEAIILILIICLISILSNIYHAYLNPGIDDPVLIDP